MDWFELKGNISMQSLVLTSQGGALWIREKNCPKLVILDYFGFFLDFEVGTASNWKKNFFFKSMVLTLYPPSKTRKLGKKLKI